jgi:hypothetical protein
MLNNLSIRIKHLLPPLISSPTPISRRRKDKPPPTPPAGCFLSSSWLLEKDRSKSLMTAGSVAAVAEGESFNENMRSEEITSPFLVE